MKLVYTLVGEHEDLEWLRTRIDGAILDEIAIAEEEERIERDTVGYGWEFDD